jgi:O-antigen/teichoic acid export membrane protein
MFLFRAVQGLSGSINGLILGSVAPVAALGEYAGADRITRVFQQGMWPVNQALYPKLTHQMQNDPNRAIRTVRLSLLLLGGLGLGFGLALFLGAPLLVHLALGPAFKNSVPVLRVFSLWIPLVALCTVMIFQLLLPNQLDKQFNLVNLTAALLGIVSTLLLAPRYKALGVAWSAVAVQLYTLLAFSLVAWRAGLNPFARATDVSGRSPRPTVLARASRLAAEEKVETKDKS